MKILILILFYSQISFANSGIIPFQVAVNQILEIKAGAELISDTGEVIPNELLVTQKLNPRSYAYCSDTCYDERIIDCIKNVNLLYHEATFLDEMSSRAKETFHTTALQAGAIAKKSEAKKLIIGHYSARYKNLEPLLLEAKSVFENTILAIEGESTVVEF